MAKLPARAAKGHRSHETRRASIERGLVRKNVRRRQAAERQRTNRVRGYTAWQLATALRNLKRSKTHGIELRTIDRKVLRLANVDH